MWIAAALAVIVAMGVAVWRQQESARVVAPEDTLARAVRLLEADPALLALATRNTVRAGAVSVIDHGLATPEADFVLATQLQAEHAFGRAEALYKEAITARPDWSAPYAGLGSLLVLHSVGRTEEARGVLTQGVELAPGSARIHSLLATLYRVEGNYAAAEAEAKQALELAPDDLATHNNYGNLLVVQGQYDDAERYYRAAIAINPRHPKPYYNLACLYARQGESGEALEYLREAVTRNTLLRREAANDPDLSAIRDTPEFRELIFGE